jgi:hypothetical protein
METLSLALEYPNGRVHECHREFARELALGAEFELHGRRWRVDHVLAVDRYRSRPQMLCRSLGPAAMG